MKQARTAIVISALIASAMVTLPSVQAAQTTGGVNWLDPLPYRKPYFIPLTVPDEASTANKYYIDLSSGSGTSCSATSPCKELRSLVGKPGIAGGPAYVYVRGSGRFFLYNDTFYGSAGKEIVIKPWGTATAVFKTSSGNQTINGSGMHHLIVDGGPSLRIHFVSDVNNQYGLHVQSDDITIYRTQAYATASSNGAMLFAACDNQKCSNVRFINNEMHTCNFGSGFQCSAIYWGPGAGGGYSNAKILNNIIRDQGGEGIEINPRVTSDNIEISGNAIHNVGKVTCSGNWQCRPGITMSIQSGGGNNGTVIQNNLIWDAGSGCIWDRGGGAPRPVIYNNTCYDYGKGSGGGGPNPQGISGYSGGGTAVVQNNIIYSPNGTAPFDRSAFVASNNLCTAGQSCGSASQAWSSSTFVSSAETNSAFLQIGSTSPAKDRGMSITTVTTDYAGGTRSGAYDIGAIEYGAAPAPPPGPLPAPSNLRIIQ